MADLIDPPPTAAKLADELRALHDRREREPLSADEEARYAELWAWWQTGGGSLAAAAPAAPVIASEAHAAPGVPEEWLAVFDEEEAAPVIAAAEVAGGAPDDADLVGEWEAWQAKQARADPFDLIPDESVASAGSSYDQVMSARAEVLGFGGEGGGLGEPEELACDAAAVAMSAAEVGEVPVDVEADEDPPPPQTEPPAAPEPARESPRPLVGARRVVIHLADGQVRRGQIIDVEVSRDTFSYIDATGSTESVARSEVRTVFFMRAPGAPGSPSEGAPIRVTLRDGRELAGKSADHETAGDGFTLVPDDTRSNAALVWVARAAVRSVSAGS